jgi:hypothetical protein
MTHDYVVAGPLVPPDDYMPAMQHHDAYVVR